MTDLEVFLSSGGHRTKEKVERIVSAIKQWWTDGVDDHKALAAYKAVLAEEGMNNFNIPDMDKLFIQDYVAFDGLYFTWRLKEDKALKFAERELAKMEKTGKCFFCGGEILFRPHLNSSLCKGSCERLFTCKSPLVLAGMQYGVNEFSVGATQLYVD